MSARKSRAGVFPVRDNLPPREDGAPREGARDSSLSTTHFPLSTKLSTTTAREIALLPVKFYRREISPLTGPCCRFTPTCSAYCMEAVRTHGILRGAALTAWRILRCNPLCHGGYDPVPPPRGKRGST